MTSRERPTSSCDEDLQTSSRDRLMALLDNNGSADILRGTPCDGERDRNRIGTGMSIVGAPTASECPHTGQQEERNYPEIALAWSHTSPVAANQSKQRSQ